MRLFLIFIVSWCVSNFYFAQTNNYYFGNLHAHTGFSDGNKDSVTSGVSKPDGAYNYAKQSSNFDFLGISEHNHYSNNNNPGFRVQSYQIGLNMADQANQDGTFLALFGMEYGVSSNYNGHVVIYGFNQLIGWETNLSGQVGANYDIFNAKTDYHGLFTKVKNNPNAFAYLAHPNFDDYSTNGSQATALAYAPYNPAYDSAIVGMPLRSGNAFSTFTDYSDYSTSGAYFFTYYKKLLYQGYHLGIGYDHDNHYTNFGRSNGGRLAIIAPSLTRSNLMLAMKNMHFYGTDDSNAEIEFSTNGNIMGSILSDNFYPTFNVIHNDPDGEQADTIKIWRGYSNSGGLWAEIVRFNKGSNTMTYQDTSIKPNIEYYYFAEIKQADGQWIVTSPIWYKGIGALGLTERNNESTFRYFPNPASKSLSFSLRDNLEFQITISDITGRKVYENNFSGKDFVIDVSALTPGAYQLSLKSLNVNVSKKLIIE